MEEKIAIKWEGKKRKNSWIEESTIKAKISFIHYNQMKSGRYKETGY